MADLLLATTNPGKVLEAQQVLSPLGINVKMLDIEVPEIKTLSIRETILVKAKTAYELSGRKAIAVEDTGLFLKAFPQFPGTYTKFAAKTIGIQGMLKLIEGKDRHAQFVTMAAFIGPKHKEPVVFEGICEGTIGPKIVPGANVFLPYDSVFIPSGFTQPFVNMSAAHKNAVSHRGIALTRLGKWLRQQKIA